MKRVAFFILFLYLAVCGQAHSAPEHDLGSAGTLEGDIYVLSVFVSDNHYGTWTTAEKDEMVKKETEALNWIKRQAAPYGVEINYTRGCYGYSGDIKLDHIMRGSASGREDVDLVGKALRAAGYSRPLAFYDWVLDETPCAETFVILYVKGNGISYNISFQKKEMDEEKYFVEGCVIYENYDDGRTMAASAIAHEILHCFGAWDLYANFAQSPEVEAHAKRLFPNSIMLRADYNINKLSVDPLTAWLIGWNDDPEGWYNSFMPDYLKH